ncbi:MAG: Ig-like domain-containing protein [Muribaculaceae bacterium]|nr:Ig-like domain-containing protein [Muribaculaceae bacterium]
MKKILLLTVGLIVSLLGASAQTVLKTIDFSDTNSYNTTAGYTQTVTSKDGFWEYSAFNSNNKDWKEIRCGSKSAATNPYIRTLEVLDVDVDYIEVTFSSIYSSTELTSAYLQSSFDPDFKSVNAEQDIKGKIVADETVRFTLTKPGINLYYRLYFATAKSTKNGQALSIKKVELFSDLDIKDLPDITFPESEYSVVLGDLFITPALNNPNEVEVVYTSSDEDVATVDPSTGAITEIKKRGNTTITATSIENDTFGVETAEYELYVTLPLPGIHFHETNLTVDLGSENIFPSLVNPKDLPVVYSSSNTKVATINANSGEITIVGTGTTRISASYSESDEDNRIFEDAEADYILTVIDGRSSVTFDFVNNTYGYNREEGSSTSYLPNLAKFTNGNVTITYTYENSAKARFWSDGLRIFKASNTNNRGVVLSIEAEKGYYISSITTNLKDKTYMAFNDEAKSEAASHEWNNTANDPTITKVDYVSYTTATKAIETITVVLKPFGASLTTGGYFTEPIEVIVSGASTDKNVTIYYADATVEEKGNVQSFTLDRNATVNVTAQGLDISETYVFSRDILSDGNFNIAYDENANAFVSTGIVEFMDDTEDKTDNYKDIYPDAYHLYVNGVDMGCFADDDNSAIELTNIMPDAKFEVAVVKNDMNFVSSNIFQVVDITDQIEWIWPDNAKEAQDMNLKMVLKNGATHFVNHTVVENVPHVFSAMRLGLEEGKVSDLLNLPVEFVVHEATHEQGRFVITPNVDADTEGDAYEIHYSVEHVGKHESIEDFYASAESTQSVSATIGLRFVADAPDTPAAAIRRAPGEAAPTQVYVNENNRTEVPSFSFATNNSEVSGIEDVAVDATEAVEYFNLQGIRLGSEPASGLYIRRQGGIATKVVR